MPTVYSHQISLRLWRYFYLVALIAFPSFYASRTSQLSDLAGTISLQPAPTLTTQPSQTLASTPSAANFKNAWVVYLDARMAELKIVFTVACVLVGYVSPVWWWSINILTSSNLVPSLSLTLFQIPQATNDPLTHALASLAQCRSISGLVFTAILYLYFKGDDAHTERFAMLWWKVHFHCMHLICSAVLRRPWIECWGLERSYVEHMDHAIPAGCMCTLVSMFDLVLHYLLTY